MKMKETITKGRKKYKLWREVSLVKKMINPMGRRTRFPRPS
jgi:hypothetical protein